MNRFTVFFFLALFLVGATARPGPTAQVGSVELVFPPGCTTAIAPVYFPPYANRPALFVSPSNENGAGFEVGGQALGNDFGAISAELDYTPTLTVTLELFWQTVPMTTRVLEPAGLVAWEAACNVP